MLTSDEFRLAYAVLLNIIVFAAAWRFARAIAEDAIEATVDAFLIFYFVQYLTIGILGLVGLLTPIAIAVAACGVAGLLARIAKPQASAGAFSRMETSIAVGVFFFVIGYAAALCFNQRFLPVMFNDALTYHVPAAVHWLQQGRMALFETWFYNPANTYSPLAGSMFIAWLLAPMGNDVLAKFVELGPLLMILFATAALARRLGLSLALSAGLALAAVFSRPFISQTIAAKDDLFVSAFALAALLAITSPRSRFAPWRAGIAIGLLLATKYTAIYCVVILLLAIDAPRRAGWKWRDYVLAAIVALAIVGPWFLRNLLLTGNPLFPMRVAIFGKTVLPGIITAARSERLQGYHNIIDALVTGYYAPDWPIAISLMVLWVTAIVLVRANAIRQPLWRAVILSPPLLILLFIATSPYGEMRFIYPALLLMFVCGAALLARLPVIIAAVLVATVASIAFYTHGFPPEVKILFTISGVIAAGAAVTLWLIREQRYFHRVLTISGVTAAGALFALVYVFWPHYIDSIRSLRAASWPTQYGPVSAGWIYVDEQIPADCTLAYTNMHFVHALHDFRNVRRLVYVPTRRGVRRISDLPALTKPISGEPLNGAIDEITVADPDRTQWLEALHASGAAYLFVALTNPETDAIAPEASFAESDSGHFHRISPANVRDWSIYRISW